MPFDATPNTPPQTREAAELSAYVNRLMAKRTKRSQLGSMFDELEDDAGTWAPRRNMLEG